MSGTSSERGDRSPSQRDVEGIIDKVLEYQYASELNKFNNKEDIVITKSKYNFCRCFLPKKIIVGNEWCSHCRYFIQSAEETDQIVSNLTNEVETSCEDVTEETVEFMDEKPGQTNGNKFLLDPIALTDKTPNVELAKFLSRPVNIGSDVYSTSDTVGQTDSLDPWFLYFNNTKIKNKLSNFAFLRCNLQLKFVVNASPFYYGANLYHYQPLYNFTPSLVTTDSNANELMEYSQRPHMWIYPQNSEGGNLTLPFFNPRNWIRVSIAQDFNDMGKLYSTCYAPLRSANGGTSTVDVQIFAWATNVELAGPSVGLALQSSDEYDDCDGIISKPASAVASALGLLSKVPIIGRFATASSIGIGAVAKIAHIFGYTNVPVVESTKPLRPNAFPQFASPEISYPTEKLSIDPKNELTIDPSSVGLPTNDELEVSYLVQRESYLCSIPWTTTNVADDILFTSSVTPKLYNVVNTTNWTVHQTPMSMVAAMFTHWRGDIIFRFKVICTQYHKGRFRFTFDPAGSAGANLTNQPDTYECAFTKVIDIAKDTDIEIRVPYMQALPWLKAHVSNATYTTTLNYSLSSSPSFAYDDRYFNGTVTIRPVTRLTAPQTSSTINILVFVRGAENLEFANPRELPQTFSYFALQSTFEYDNPDEKIMNNGVTIPAPERYLTNFGEAIPSIRTLLRRTNFSVLDSPTTDITSNQSLYKIYFSKWPLYWGYQLSKGIHSAKGILAPLSNFKFNYVNTGPWHWVAPCFIGHRGSFHWHFNVDNPNQLSHITAYRVPFANSAGASVTSNAKTTYSADARFYHLSTVSGAAGQSLTTQFTQAGLSVGLPNYTNFKFQSTNPNGPNNMVSPDGSDDEFHILQVGYSGTANLGSTNLRIWRYYSVGTDYNLFYFINTPTLIRYSSEPTAN